MTDQNFEKAMKSCYRAFKRHEALLEKIEKEYERRFGESPSELDDDFWIDTFHYGTDEPDFHEIIKSAQNAKQRNY